MEAQTFNDLLKSISVKPLRVIDASIELKDYVSIDLSSTNKTLSALELSSSKAWQGYIDTYLIRSGATIAYGGYLEQRNIYRRSSYFKRSTSDSERNIHLGIDLWCNAGTQVLSVLDGEIHSFQNNTNFGDYGPTIILKHRFARVEFYSLYGHLSLTSIQHIRLGQNVKRGEVIGTLGDSTVNGDYAPHLHFQLIRDIDGMFGDYPGVSSAKNVAFYRQNCPDPNLLLKL